MIDRRLGTYIVPRTEIVSLASPAFFYDWIDRNAFERSHKPRPLPLKPGSFQLFARGFTDGSVFLREHPWPTGDEDLSLAPTHRRHKRSVFSACCGRAGHFEDDGAVPASGDAMPPDPDQGFVWTEELMADFRAELGALIRSWIGLTRSEKLVILDFLIRNTDRGLDNLMIRVSDDRTRVHVVAIDNSLAFPHEHPRGYRDYPWGWLWLRASHVCGSAESAAASLIGQPFSEATRKRFLPLLSSAEWCVGLSDVLLSAELNRARRSHDDAYALTRYRWAGTTRELRVLFSSDPDFSGRSFDKQLAVMKGQALAIVQTLLNDDDGARARAGRSLTLQVRSSCADDRACSSGTTASSSRPTARCHPRRRRTREHRYRRCRRRLRSGQRC